MQFCYRIYFRSISEDELGQIDNFFCIHKAVHVVVIEHYGATEICCTTEKDSYLRLLSSQFFSLFFDSAVIFIISLNKLEFQNSNSFFFITFRAMLFLSIDDLVIVDLLDSNIFSYHKKSSFCCLRRLIIVSTSLQLTLFQTFKLISRETNNTLWLFKKKIPKILCGHKLWIYKVIYAHTLPVKRPITIKMCFTRAMYFYLQLGWCLRF